MQVEIDQEHPRVHFLREREREIDGRQALALTCRRARDADRAPVVGGQAMEHARAQDLVRTRDRDVRDAEQDVIAFDDLRIGGGRAEMARRHFRTRDWRNARAPVRRNEVASGALLLLRRFTQRVFDYAHVRTGSAWS